MKISECNSDILVTIITPTYNRAALIKETIESVQAQTYANYEHLIVDDGSIDETRQVVEKYSKEDPRIIYIPQNHSGPGPARNRGLERARGEFVQFLDSDDLLHPNKIKRQLEALIKDEIKEYVGANCDCIQFRDTPEDILHYVKLGNLDNELFRLLHLSSYYPNPIHCKLLRKQAILEAGAYDDRLKANEDRFLYTKIALNGGRYVYTSFAGAYQRLRPDSYSSDDLFMESQHVKFIDIAYRLILDSKLHEKNKYFKILTERYASGLRIHTHQTLSDEVWCSMNDIARMHNIDLRSATKGRKNLIISGFNRLFDLVHSKIKMDVRKRSIKTDLIESLNDANINFSKNNLLSFMSGLSKTNGKFKYSESSPEPILYGSIYAAMTYGLLGELYSFPEETKREWANYINEFQCEDGLFRDPLLFNNIAEVEDWWGWRHLSAHAVTALSLLGSKTAYPFTFVEPLYKRGEITRWISSLPWKTRSADVSNTVMNFGVCLQYNRDFWGHAGAGRAMEELFDWLDNCQDRNTGCWGEFEDNEMTASLRVQTSYHIWILYFFDRRQINYINNAIDSILDTQNELGGFGLALNSSACEDIDSIDPLCRFYYMTDYRKRDIEEALKKALKWIPVNQNNNGGFVFKRFEHFFYGHELMSTRADESSMFPSWFRTLSLAYISRVLRNDERINRIDWSFISCPGYQFWNC